MIPSVFPASTRGASASTVSDPEEAIYPLASASRRRLRPGPQGPLLRLCGKPPVRGVTLDSPLRLASSGRAAVSTVPRVVGDPVLHSFSWWTMSRPGVDRFYFSVLYWWAFGLVPLFGFFEKSMAIQGSLLAGSARSLPWAPTSEEGASWETF